MSLPTVKAFALNSLDSRAAYSPVWMRTLEKSIPKRLSIELLEDSGSGLPPPLVDAI
jgi:hypothetical protein